MHTSRDGRPELAPAFGQVTTVGGDGPTLSICLRCRDGREGRDTDRDRRGAAGVWRRPWRMPFPTAWPHAGASVCAA